MKVFRFIRTVWKYRKVLWDYCEWDWSQIVEVMEVAISILADHIENGCRHVGYEKEVRHMRIAQELCERVAKQDPPGWCESWRYKNDWRHLDRVNQQNHDALFDLLKNRIQYWWD